MTQSKGNTKVSVRNLGLEISAQIERDDVSPAQMFELFKSVFLGCTYTWEQWHEQIRREAEEGE
jgi:hypothetical protein